MTEDLATDWRARIGNAQRLLEERLDDDVPLEELAATTHASMFPGAPVQFVDVFTCEQVSCP